MNNLRKALSRLFDPACLLPGTSIGENQRVFSIKPEPGEQVAGVRVDGCVVTDSLRPRCDGLFVLLPPGSPYFVIALVELKGNDVGRAKRQLLATQEFLLERLGCALGHHGVEILRKMSFQPLTGRSHGGMVLGIVVSRGRLVLGQRDIMRLRKNRIKWKHFQNASGLKIRELTKLVY